MWENPHLSASEEGIDRSVEAIVKESYQKFFKFKEQKFPFVFY